jgi:molyBdopterin-guanine dinucleotide biosynthesis protein b related protein
MGLMDVFKEEETANLRLSTLYELLKQSAQKELIINGINCDVPHKYLREIITGNLESNIFSGVDNISSKEREE